MWTNMIIWLIASLLGPFLGQVLLANAQNLVIPDDQNIDPSIDLNTLANNSLYLRWRPLYHVMPPGGWMNDPCGPMYDPIRQTYHIFYQAFPQHTQFGNISWSHATSPNLIDWTDVQDWRNKSMLAIDTGDYPSYDWTGAFSGGAQPVNLRGEQDGNLTLMYTGARRWPINWQIPYGNGSESQAIATSSDGGLTWQKYAGNPVIEGAPGGWNITSLRDPVFQKMPELDAVLGREEPHWYMVMGSGIRGVGPRLPLYSAPGNDLTNWTFLGALFEVDLNTSWSGDTRTGSWGGNFELAGFFPLPELEQNGGDDQTQHWIATMGAEGCTTEVHPRPNWQLFAMGDMAARPNGSAQMTITAAGALDWGNSYAGNQFYDLVGNRRVIWGWSTDDINNYGVVPQGYSGALGLPRELYVLKTHDVVAPAGGIPLGPEKWQPGITDQTWTVTTLAQRPLPDLVNAIQSKCIEVGDVTIQSGNTTLLEGVEGQHLHMRATLGSFPENHTLTILFRASPDLVEHTKLIYQPHNQSVLLSREHSSLITQFNSVPYTGSFAPYTLVNRTDNSTSTEPVVMDLFLDGSMLEFFINNRFALTMRVYPSRADSTRLGFRFDPVDGDYGSQAEDDVATMMDVKVWMEMRNVYPNRPRNASSPLEYDPYYKTHVTFDNPYVDEGTQLYPGYRTRRSMRSRRAA